MDDHGADNTQEKAEYSAGGRKIVIFYMSLRSDIIENKKENAAAAKETKHSQRGIVAGKPDIA